MKAYLTALITLLPLLHFGQDLSIRGERTIVTNKDPYTQIKQNVINNGNGNYFKVTFYNNSFSQSIIEINNTQVVLSNPSLYKTVEQDNGLFKPKYILYRYRCHNPDYGECDFYIVRKKKDRELLYVGLDFFNQSQMMTLFPNKSDIDNLKTLHND